MNDSTPKKSWLTRHWKWAFPSTTIALLITVFFYFTGDATFRYGSAHMQPGLIKEAYKMANKNDTVVQKLGEISEYNFLRLIEGEVMYSNNNNTVNITVKLLGSKKKGMLDILAHRQNDTWEYQKITVRIKKPKKETIEIFKK
ncbi:cytochrome c oxidase assembly factor Coa1 family protein [Aquimarina gracilis]|uniref:Cytochrome c oxidase assembly factor Coa1 family protein n=1 Tax=Aquimarina gracilis TaxID=874422 RepID=A0ABU5ZRI1_9FLAO|nr:cytochrome c oxidase assembly factor Coa1 family protein [Aquimarina gracilis]MEB3343972.1 cytochrome c oxidase assembly factor Coa1 family protein [Aquimarina gracilis]